MDKCLSSPSLAQVYIGLEPIAIRLVAAMAMARPRMTLGMNVKTIAKAAKPLRQDPYRPNYSLPRTELLCYRPVTTQCYRTLTFENNDLDDPSPKL